MRNIMIRFKDNDINFYIKVFLWGFCFCCVVWSFMLFQFWWGNHDWDYLRDGIKLQDGFFEARYSQHLPTVLFLNGQILPFFSCFLSLGFLSLLGVLLAYYLHCPKDRVVYGLFICFLATLPHTAILFYYVFIMFPLFFWGCVGAGLLFLSVGPYRLWKFIGGICGFIILLGSYPPVISLVLTVFIARHILYYIQGKQSFKEIIFNGLFLLGQLLLAYTIYRGIFLYLGKIGALNTKMYNVVMRDVVDIFRQIVTEVVAPISVIPQIAKSTGAFYTILYCLLMGSGLGIIFYLAPNRFIAFLLVCGLFLASRIAFLLSASAYSAAFRVTWWGEIGLMLSFLAILLQVKKQWVRNLIYLGCVLFCISFIKTDSEIQKVQWLAFNGENLFHKRVKERLFSYPQFDFKRHYITLNIGYPDFHRQFCYKNCQGFNNELLDSTVLPADFGKVIFTDETNNPVSNRLGYWGKQLYFVTEKSNLTLASYVSENELSDMRYYLYKNSLSYPEERAVYINHNLIVFNLEQLSFYKEREDILHQLGHFLGR